MQFTLTINQQKALEWGLNAQQALLFAFVYECPSWAKPMTTPRGTFFALAKAKIIDELPLLTDKPDTAYRLLKQLEEAGVIELSHTAGITLVRLTDLGKEWNRKLDGSEKYPSKPGEGRKKIRGTSEKSPRKVGKKSEVGSEESPTNQDTSNQDTNQETSQCLSTQADAQVAAGNVVPFAKRGAAKPGTDAQFEAVWAIYPKRDGSNPKTKALSAWKARLRDGVSPEDMAQGVIRYAAYCAAKGSTGTEFVMQAQRFFGPGREFENPWSAPTTASAAASRHHGFDQRDYTAGTTQREDGTHAF